MALRSYSGNAKRTTLTGGITSTATTFNVADGTNYPDGSTAPFVITIDSGLAAEEKILCELRTGNSFTVAAGGRGWDGTAASAHENQAAVAHTFSATDAREANLHVNQTAVGDSPHPQYLNTLTKAVRAMSAQSIPTGTLTAITFDAATNNTAGMWSAASPTRLTVAVAGRYLVTASTRYLTSADTGLRLMRTRLNGTTTLDEDQRANVGTFHGSGFIAGVHRLFVGDYLELIVRQDSGGALSTQNSDHTPSLSAVLLARD